MALDRQSIEKRDFPVGRRGYDPEAVDAHLSALADEIAELRSSSRRRSDTLASSASDQVRAIVEAAETSAADIQREAEADAKEIRDEANSEARSTREQATQSAREYLGRVSESSDAMVSRLDGMQSELDQLVETLRTGSNRLSADLTLLQDELGETAGVVAPRPGFEPELAAGQAGDQPLADGEPTPAAAAPSGPAPEDVAPVAATPVAEDAPGVGGFAVGDDDTEGARLIALNMALNGTSRDETARYLEENFALSDVGGLLDEVYESVEG